MALHLLYSFLLCWIADFMVNTDPPEVAVCLCQNCPSISKISDTTVFFAIISLTNQHYAASASTLAGSHNSELVLYLVKYILKEQGDILFLLRILFAKNLRLKIFTSGVTLAQYSTTSEPPWPSKIANKPTLGSLAKASIAKWSGLEERSTVFHGLPNGIVAVFQISILFDTGRLVIV